MKHVYLIEHGYYHQSPIRISGGDFFYTTKKAAEQGLKNRGYKYYKKENLWILKEKEKYAKVLKFTNIKEKPLWWIEPSLGVKSG